LLNPVETTHMIVLPLWSVWRILPVLVRKNVKWGSSSPSWTDCKNQLQKFIMLGGSRGCKSLTTVTLYSRSLNSFVTKAADDLKMPASCASCLSDFCSLYSNLDPILSSFSLVSTQCFLARFLSRSVPVDLTLFSKIMHAFYAWTYVPRKFITKFSPTLSSRTTFYIQFIQKNALFNSKLNHIHTQQ
jgi:hypothetical protein